MQKYQIVMFDRGEQTFWQIIHIRKNVVVGEYECEGEAFKAVQMMLEDERHPNY